MTELIARLQNTIMAQITPKPELIREAIDQLKADGERIAELEKELAEIKEARGY